MADTLQEILQKWGDEQIAEAITLINSAGISTSGNLVDTLRVEVVQDAETITLSIIEPEYGKFVREGVKGAESSFKAPNSPFQYSDKMPPPGPIDKWVVKKGLQGTRDSQGRFVSRKSMTFAIQRSIYKFGIPPFNYLSPFFKNINDLQGLVTENQRREILLLLQNAFNERT